MPARLFPTHNVRLVGLHTAAELSAVASPRWGKGGGENPLARRFVPPSPLPCARRRRWQSVCRPLSGLHPRRRWRGRHLVRTEARGFIIPAAARFCFGRSRSVFVVALAPPSRPSAVPCNPDPLSNSGRACRAGVGLLRSRPVRCLSDPLSIAKRQRACRFQPFRVRASRGENG